MVNSEAALWRQWDWSEVSKTSSPQCTCQCVHSLDSGLFTLPICNFVQTPGLLKCLCIPYSYYFNIKKKKMCIKRNHWVFLLWNDAAIKKKNICCKPLVLMNLKQTWWYVWFSLKMLKSLNPIYTLIIPSGCIWTWCQIEP